MVEKELNKLAKFAYLEDAWIYHRGKLIDAGYGEGRGVVNMSIEMIKNLELEKGEHIKMYHIHPVIKANDLSPPSIRDVFFHSHAEKYLNEKGVDLTSKVFVGIGAWEYKLIKPKSTDSTSTNMWESELGLKVLERTILKVHKNSLWNEELSQKEKLEKYARQSKLLGIEAIFQPME